LLVSVEGVTRRERERELSRARETLKKKRAIHTTFETNDEDSLIE
jgi:hypothetical protein